MAEFYHEPVLLDEVLNFLITDKEGIYIDATLGGGGHTLKILESLKGNSQVLGFDEDIDAISHVEKYLSSYRDHLILVNENYSNLLDTVRKLNYSGKISGILFDLGVSSRQIDQKDKGFTYREDSPLDMRMNRNKGISAAEVLNSAEASDLERIFRDYGEEKRARFLARRIIDRRQEKMIKTSNDFIDILRGLYRPNDLNKNLSRLFQALRIEINNELEHLSIALNNSIEALAVGGRLVVISYHSLEDRIVKNFFRDSSRKCNCPPDFPECMCGAVETLQLVTRKPILPSDDEIRRNVRARSAKLRVAERI
jgi:16S rRNA (cytosine1402-N4)-methyltransferase